METRLLPLAVLGLFTICPAVPASADHVRCGQPSTTGETPKSSDALAILRSAVGISTCDLCVCDVNESGTKTSGDALLTLRRSVGQNVALVCPDCRIAENVGAAGGTVPSHDGRLVLEFPPDAVAAATDITIEGAAPSSLAPEFDDTEVYQAYDLGPDGLQLDPPASVSYALPNGAFAMSGNSVTLTNTVLMTENGGEPEPLDNLVASVDVEAGTVELRGELSHFSPVAIVDQQGPITFTIEDFPDSAVVGETPFAVHLTVSSEIAIPKPVLLEACAANASKACTEACGLHVFPFGSFTKVGDDWKIEVLAECQKPGFCDVFFNTAFETSGALGKVLVLSQETLRLECKAAEGPIVLVPRTELQAPYAFRGPYADILTSDEIVGIGTKDGSTAFNLDTEEVEFDLDDGMTSNGHYVGLPLRFGPDMGKQAWLHAGPQGIAIWNYDEKTGFGMPDISGGAFNQFEDAMPVPPPASAGDAVFGAGIATDRIGEVAYAVNVQNRTIVTIGYDGGEGKYKLLGEVVGPISAPSQNPSSVFPFPNGSMVITGLGNAVNVEGKLMFHGGTNAATQPTLIGDIGLYPRRIRCAACDASGVYTCLSSATFSSELFISKINPDDGAASITDSKTTGQGPYGVAIVPKLSGQGCFGVVTHYGGGGYTLCDIATNGTATCQPQELPEECPDPRHVTDLLDGSFLVTCENQQAAVRIPRPSEP
jgi:hypothetical protein